MADYKIINNSTLYSRNTIDGYNVPNDNRCPTYSQILSYYDVEEHVSIEGNYQYNLLVCEKDVAVRLSYPVDGGGSNQYSELIVVKRSNSGFKVRCLAVNDNYYTGAIPSNSDYTEGVIDCYSQSGNYYYGNVPSIDTNAITKNGSYVSVISQNDYSGYNEAAMHLLRGPADGDDYTFGLQGQSGYIGTIGRLGYGKGRAVAFVNNSYRYVGINDFIIFIPENSNPNYIFLPLPLEFDYVVFSTNSNLTSIPSSYKYSPNFLIYNSNKNMQYYVFENGVDTTPYTAEGVNLMSLADPDLDTLIYVYGVVGNTIKKYGRDYFSGIITSVNFDS